MSEVGELRNMGPATAFEKIEQRTGGACQDPLCREAGLGDQPVAVLEIPEAEGHVGVGAEGEVGTQVPRRLDDRAEVGEAGASLAGRAPLSRASSRRAYQRTSAATASTAAGLQSSATAGALPPRARATRGLPREGCRPR